MREHPAIGDAIIKPDQLPGRGARRRCAATTSAGTAPATRTAQGRGDSRCSPASSACADTFDACTSTRPYQKAMPLEKAMEILDNLSGKQLDPAVVAALRRVVEKKGVRVEGHRLPVKLAS